MNESTLYVEYGINWMHLYKLQNDKFVRLPRVHKNNFDFTQPFEEIAKWGDFATILKTGMKYPIDG